jgi:DNA-binding NarL/FixJ family response regulator
MTEPSHIRVILAEDHELIRSAIVSSPHLVGRNIRIVATVTNGEDLIDAYQTHQPDVVVTDLRMPGMGGLEAIRQLRIIDASSRILAVTGHEDPQSVRDAVRAGAIGFAFKQEIGDGDTWASLVEQVAAGQRVMFGKAMEIVMNTIQDGSRVTLAPRERDVLILVGAGLRNQDIAARLNVAPTSVKDALDRIFDKLGIRTRMGAHRRAVEMGLLSE